MSPGLRLAVSFGGAAAFATVLGGVLALRMRRSLNTLLSFGSGVVLGVALLDLFPEALALGEGAIAHTVTVATAIGGFVLYFALSRLGANSAAKPRGWLSQLSVASLVVHSGLDGFGIGSAFEASDSIGVAVAAGVIAHDLVDGTNTVAFSLNSGARATVVQRWLLVDGAAPIVGILLSRMLRAPDWGISTILALMTGGFTYISLSVARPPIHAGRPFKALVLGATGLIFVFIVVKLTRAQA